MEKNLTPELKAPKEEFNFIYKKWGIRMGNCYHILWVSICFKV